MIAGVDALRGYYVCCQHYYYSGDYAVEITEGGLDYAGPDHLVEQYPELGEGEAFQNPQDAALAAFKILRAWRKDEPEKHVILTVRTQLAGYWGMEGEPWETGDVKRWAREAWEALPKCPRCGEPKPEEGWGNCFTVFDDEYPYCSEYCADEHYHEMMQELEEEEEYV